MLNIEQDEAPVVAEAYATVRKGLPFCSACGRLLQHETQNRCPYASCRRWLRGRDNLFTPKAKKGKERA